MGGILKDKESENMAAIHLIKKDRSLPGISPIERGSEIFRSGYWVIVEAKANSLIGGKIFFHEEQTKPSFFGGVIMNTKREDQGDHAGRIVLP